VNLTPSSRASKLHWARRVGWLLLIWLVSVAALGIVAIGFRLIMGWAGLTR
jgi:hypothetical protein